MIGAIENAILAKLEAAGGVAGFHYAFDTLEASPDDWDVLIASLSKGTRTPAAWVGFFGWDTTVQEDGGVIRAEGTRFVLIVMSRSLRNGADVRQAGRDAPNPGSYQLLQDVTACLSGFDGDLPMRPLSIGKSWMIRRSQKMRDDKLSAFAIELKTDIWIAPIATDGNVQPFTHFHADWDVQPFGAGRDGGPILPIPNPENADAADDVALPGATA